METLRLFIALRPPSPAMDAIVQEQERIRETVGSEAVRWINRSNVHLTLQFLGDVPSGRVNDVKDCVSEAVTQTGISEPVPLFLEGTGAFPSAARARVIWVGVTDSTRRLSLVTGALRGSLERMDFEMDPKPFRPHITIGYVRRRATREDQKKIADAIRTTQLAAVPFAFTHVHLVHSTLSPAGARYADLHSVSLFPESSATSSAESARE